MLHTTLPLRSGPLDYGPSVCEACAELQKYPTPDDPEYCAACWPKELQRRTAMDEVIGQILLHDYNTKQKMLQLVREIQTTEQVPIKYAVGKYKRARREEGLKNPPNWCERDLIEKLTEELQIVRVKNEFVCNKHRVDAMDFEVWARTPVRHWDGE
ncbi:hypothetical protein BST61_g9520 [Cercospora zeina]